MLLCITSWQIWKHRNAVLFEDDRSTPHDTFSLAWRNMEEWRDKLGPRRNRSTTVAARARWRPPYLAALNLTLMQRCSWTTLLGFVIRNERGEVMAAGSRRQQGGGSSTLIKATALRFGIGIAYECGLNCFTLESDSECLIKAINGEIIEEPYVMALVQDIRRLACQVNCSSFCFVRREANTVAHNLAHFCKSSNTKHIWIEEVPNSCTVLIKA